MTATDDLAKAQAALSSAISSLTLLQNALLALSDVDAALKDFATLLGDLEPFFAAAAVTPLPSSPAAPSQVSSGTGDPSSAAGSSVPSSDNAAAAPVTTPTEAPPAVLPDGSTPPAPEVTTPAS